MHIRYEPDSDILTITFQEGVAAHEGEDVAPGVILRTDEKGNPVRLEILDAAGRVTDPGAVKLEVGATAPQVA